jgi:MurNAc alpha-1-phosphate uridylyltransferase
MKAMVFAAGRGVRMQPLTASLPKPLIPVAGKALLERHLERLAAAGFRRVIINVSHLGEQIVARFGDGAALGLQIYWSREDDPLETAGGIARALPILGTGPFLAVSADIWCDFDFHSLAGHELKGLSHLVLVPNPAHHPSGDFSLEGGVVGNGDSPRYTYAGIAVISPRLVAEVTPGTKAQLAPLWRAAAARGAVSGERYEGRWSDVGTPQRLAELEATLKER